MTQRLLGKTALLTACAQGIGRATALAFAAEGAKVIATDINATKLAEIAGPNITTSALDVLDAGAVQALTAQIGPVDVLFNCAGFVHQGTVLEATEAEWDFAFNLNVRSMFRLIQAVLPGMVAQGSGAIINMASAASSIKGAPGRFIYGTTKAAVIGLTKSIAADFVDTGKKFVCFVFFVFLFQTCRRLARRCSAARTVRPSTTRSGIPTTSRPTTASTTDTCSTSLTTLPGGSTCPDQTR